MTGGAEEGWRGSTESGREGERDMQKEVKGERDVRKPFHVTLNEKI